MTEIIQLFIIFTTQTIMSVRSITSSTRIITLLTNDILSISIIIVTNRRTNTISINQCSFCLSEIIITGKTGISILATETIISTGLASVHGGVESSSTNTFKCFRINDFEFINTASLTVGVITCDNLTV